MGVEDFHSIAFESSGNFSVRAVLEALFGGNINQEPLILEYSKFILEERNDFDELFTLDSEFLVHGNVFNNNVSKVVPSRIKLMITAKDGLF